MQPQGVKSASRLSLLTHLIFLATLLGSAYALSEDRSLINIIFVILGVLAAYLGLLHVKVLTANNEMLAFLVLGIDDQARVVEKQQLEAKVKELRKSRSAQNL